MGNVLDMATVKAATEAQDREQKRTRRMCDILRLAERIFVSRGRSSKETVEEQIAEAHCRAEAFVDDRIRRMEAAGMQFWWMC